MKLLVIDGNSIINRAFYGVKSALTNAEGVPTNAVYGFTNLLLKTEAEYRPDMIACAFDRREPTFRHKMYDGYKATRKGMPDELAVQMPLLKELLDSFGICRLELAGYEADDIIGTLSAKCEKEGVDCVILTGDRDDFQLIGDKTKVAFTVTKNHETTTELKGEAEIKAEYGGLAPRDLIEVKALMGDSSDNVPGVPGIGEKSALELIAAYKTLENLYDRLDDIKGSRREKLEAGRDSAFLSRDLVTIDRAVPLDVTFDDMVFARKATPALMDNLRRLGFNSIIKKLDFDSAADPEPEKEALPEIAVSDISAVSLKDLPSLNIYAAGGEIYLFDGASAAVISDADAASLKPLFENAALPKYVFGLKALYRYALRNGLELAGACFDVETAAYLINPSAPSYTLGGTVSSCLGKAAVKDVDCLPLIKDLSEKMRENLASLGMEKLYDEIELPLTRVLAEMEHYGFKADADALRAYGKTLSAEIEKLVAEIYGCAGCEFNLNSPKQLGEVLFEKLGLKGRKKNKNGYSTDAATLEKLSGKHPIIGLILEYRGLSKLKSTYADGLLREIAADGRIHSTFLQTVTQTGRISSKEPNLQNIPVRKEQGRELRKMFVAEDGMTLLDGDYSQIELRVLADVSEDPEMCDAFLHGEDIHTKTAAEVFGMHPAFVTPLMRTRAKAVNFGIVYGIGEYSLSQDLKISVAEARSYINGYLTTYGGVKDYMERTVAEARKNGFVTTKFGRIRYIPELSAANKNIEAFGERVARNTPIQGTAADIIKIAMIRVSKRLKAEKMKARLILQIHDELIVECPEEEREKASAIMKEEMEGAAKLRVPLTVDITSGKSWYDAK